MRVRNREKLHRYYYFGVVFLCFLPFWPLLRFWSRNPDRHYSRFVQVRRWIAQLSSAIAGFRFQISYEVPIDWSKTFILCPNHSSNLDIAALIKVCPTDFSFMGKKELLDNPVTGIYFKTIDIPVDRKSNLSGYRAFKRAAEYLDKGRSVVIFPEGGISDHYPPLLGAFKSGPFRLAAEKNVPIIPVIIHNAWEHHWDDGSPYGSRPGTIYIDVLAPIDPKTYIDSTLAPESLDKGAQNLQNATYQKIYHTWNKVPKKGCNK